MHAPLTQKQIFPTNPARFTQGAVPPALSRNLLRRPYPTRVLLQLHSCAAALPRGGDSMLANMPKHNSRSSTKVAFRPASQPGGDTQQQHEEEVTVDWYPVCKYDHWSNLLTGMPGLSTTSWCGRLGQFVIHTGPTNSEGTIARQGGLLHMWKAQVTELPEVIFGPESIKALAGQHSEMPSAVDIRYYSAPGVSVVRKPDGASGAHSGRAQTADGEQLLWDQKALAAHPIAFVFNPGSPPMSLTLKGWEAQAKHLYRVMKLLPLDNGGLAIVHAAMPGGFGPDLAAQHPEGSNWFFEVLLRHPDDAGKWHMSRLAVTYDWKDGRLGSHRYSWQKDVAPVEPPADNSLSQVLLPTVTMPNRDTSVSLPMLLNRLCSLSNLQHSSTTLCYSKNEQQQLLCRRTEPQAANNQQLSELLSAAALAGTDSKRVASSTTAMEALRDDNTAAAGEYGAATTAVGAGKGGPNLAVTEDGYVTLWFPHGGMYARLPVELPAMAVEEAIEFEFGAVHGRGSGLSRCVLVYGGSGDGQLQQVQTDEWSIAGASSSADCVQ